MAVAAAFAAPTVATAAPSLGGMMQVEIANVSDDGYGENNTQNARVGVNPGESAIKVEDNKRGRLWVKGSEDLGNGLKANYKFEWQLNTPKGALNDGAREGWVGLSGAFGEFEAGRIRSSYKYTGGVTYDPFVTTYMEARKSGGMIGGDFGQNGFWSDSISWKKKFGAFKLWINAGLDEGDGANLGASNSVGAGKGAGLGDVAVSGLYKGGNWEVFGAYSKDDLKSNVEGAANNSRDIKKFGGQIKVAGAHTFSLQYEIDDQDGNNTDSDILFFGYQMKMGKNVFVVQIGQTDHDLDANDTDYYALGVIHKFTKSTRTFVGYRVSDQDDDAVSGAGSENELSVLSVGLRIDF